MKTILLCGRMYSGKDTVARKIIMELAYYGISYRVASFAYPIKLTVAKRHGVELATLEARKHIYRPELQELGARCRHVFGDTFWPKRLLKEIELIKKTTLTQRDRVLVVPDLRYISEYNYMKDNTDPFVIYVDTDLGAQEERAKKAGQELINTSHESEQESNLIPYDFYIDNKSYITFDELQAQALKCIDFYLKKG